MANEILEEFEQKIDEFTLIPSSGGAFEVVVGDNLVYSKKMTGSHTDYTVVGPAIRKLLK